MYLKRVQPAGAVSSFRAFPDDASPHRRFRRALAAFAALLGAAAGISAQAGARSTVITNDFSLTARPSGMVPILDSAEVFTFGGALSLGAEYGFGGAGFAPIAGVSLDYGLLPFRADDSLSLLNLEARGGGRLSLGSRFLLGATMGAGYYFGLINSSGISGSGAAVSVGADLRFLVSPSLDLALGVGYRNYLGLYHGIALNLGTTVFLQGEEARAARIESSRRVRPEFLQDARPHKPGRGIEIEKIEVLELFPVFHKYYDDHPLGRALISNREPETVGDIKLTFFLKQFMDAPQVCPAPASLGRGESLAVDLVALINDTILGSTESTKAQAEVVLEYRLGEELYRNVRTLSVRVFDRNAMTWEDDRRAAAFVTAKDPKVLALSKAVTGLIRGQGPAALDQNLMFGIGIFKALDLIGLSYVVDPKTPFAKLSERRTEVDYLQFPRQTLEFKAGDCDDLSILWCALLESVGIETAFITVPGHILAAFALETVPDRVAKDFTTTQDLIVRGGKVWVPVELTERRRGFLSAWQEGARQWREASAKNAAGFHPVHDAWLEYEPVGLPGGGAEISMPPAESIVDAFLRETARLADRELLPKVARLEEDLKAGKDAAVTHNRLGILYAKYGKMDKAEEEFTRALGRGNYVPALVNLGNLRFLAKDYPKAQEWYERAIRLEPNNPTVLGNLVKIYYEQERYGPAKASYDKLARLAPDIARDLAYLVNTASDTRAAALDARRAAVLWGGQE